MARALKVCSASGCYELVERGRCPTHTRAADHARGTATERGYTSSHWRASRRACLRAQPICMCHDTTHGHGRECLSISTVADHHPATRKALVARGVPDPDALVYLRGVCKPCHDRHTAVTSPGGWHGSP
jgi:5-methylcytosine-specific restriction protein A